jgi:type IV secretion system protein VirB10
VAGPKKGNDILDFVFPSRIDYLGHLSTRQYARLVDEWVSTVGLDKREYGTHSMRRTKASFIYKATGNLTEPVFDTVTGRILLVPQGSRLIGSYDSVVAFGQSRALLVWQRIILPDGSSIQIDNLPATDAAGYAGLSDKVDYHSWRLLKGVALSTLLGVGTELSIGDNESDLVRALRQSTQQSANQAGQQIVGKNLNIQPTITVRPGWPLRVIVHKDIQLRPWGGVR